MNKGDRIKVDFVSESRTEFSGNHFTGEGVVDRVEDGRVFGRLDNGTPFMCGVDDVQVITGQSDIHDVFQKWFTEQDFYKNLRYQEGNRLFLRDGDVYRYLPVHMTFVTWSEKQKLVDSALKLIDGSYTPNTQLMWSVGKVLRGEHETD